MPRKALPPAEPVGPEFVGATPPELAAQEVNFRQAQAAMQAELQRFSDGQPYDRQRVIGEARAFMAQSAEAMLEAGKRLIVLKGNEPHGDFVDIVENQLGLASRTAQVMMQASMKYLSPALESKAQTFALLGKSKLFELMLEDDQTLVDLADGGSLIGLTLDDIDSMSVRELKAALRAERESRQEDQQIHEELLTSKNQKLDQLDRQLTELQRRGPVLVAWPEQSAAVQQDIANWAAGATELIGRLAQSHVATTQLFLQDDAWQAPALRQAIAAAELDAINRLVNQIAALQAAIYDEYADLSDQPVALLQPVRGTDE